MKLEIEISEQQYNNIMELQSANIGRVPYKGIIMYAVNAIKRGKALEQEPTTKIEESNFSQEQYKADIQSAYDCGKSVIDKIRAEIEDCLKALDEIEKSGFNIYLPNEMSGRRLTYQQCLKFIDKYKGESEGKK